jgi:hypothetical protein
MIANLVLVLLHFLCLFVAFVGCVFVCVYAYRMLAEIPPTRRHLANLMPYLVGVVPGLLTPAGHRARTKLAVSICVVVVAGVAGLATRLSL